MKKVINNVSELDKKDKIILFLLGSTISNIAVAIIKFTLSLTIPSMWFFVNAIFSFVLALCRFSTIKRYKIISSFNSILFNWKCNIWNDMIHLVKVMTQH